MKYIIQARETGEYIDECATREIAESKIMEFEQEDRSEETYTPDFYEVKEVMEKEDCIRAAGPLYDGGWRASDRAVLAVEYDLEGQALDWVCEELERIDDGYYGIIEEDDNGWRSSDNDGARSLEEAIGKAERMCSNTKTAKALVFRNADPDDILAVAVAPCDDAWEVETGYRDTLRASMFGQDTPGEFKDQLDDVEGFIDWGMDILTEFGVDHRFLVSDNPVVFNPAIHEIPVYSTKAVRSALKSVFEDEVETWKAEQEAE